MAGKEVPVKKYAVRRSEDERRRLEEMVRKRKSPAKRVLKARILLKADVSERGEGWSDGKIIEALDTNAAMVYRVRKQLVEDWFEAALSRKQRTTQVTPRIFDGGKSSQADRLGLLRAARGPRTLDIAIVGKGGRPIGNYRVRQRQHDRADSQKKPAQTPPQGAMGHRAGGQQRIRSRDGGCAGRVHSAARSYASIAVHGRIDEAIDQGNARTAAGGARASGACR